MEQQPAYTSRAKGGGIGITAILVFLIISIIIIGAVLGASYFMYGNLTFTKNDEILPEENKEEKNVKNYESLKELYKDLLLSGPSKAERTPEEQEKFKKDTELAIKCYNEDYGVGISLDLKGNATCNTYETVYGNGVYKVPGTSHSLFGFFDVGRMYLMTRNGNELMEKVRSGEMTREEAGKLAYEDFFKTINDENLETLPDNDPVAVMFRKNKKDKNIPGPVRMFPPGFVKRIEETLNKKVLDANTEEEVDGNKGFRISVVAGLVFNEKYLEQEKKNAIPFDSSNVDERGIKEGYVDDGDLITEDVLFYFKDSYGNPVLKFVLFHNITKETANLSYKLINSSNGNYGSGKGTYFPILSEENELDLSSGGGGGVFSLALFKDASTGSVRLRTETNIQGAPGNPVPPVVVDYSIDERYEDIEGVNDIVWSSVVEELWKKNKALVAFPTSIKVFSVVEKVYAPISGSDEK